MKFVCVYLNSDWNPLRLFVDGCQKFDTETMEKFTAVFDVAKITNEYNVIHHSSITVGFNTDDDYNFIKFLN